MRHVIFMNEAIEVIEEIINNDEVYKQYTSSKDELRRLFNILFDWCDDWEKSYENGDMSIIMYLGDYKVTANLDNVTDYTGHDAIYANSVWSEHYDISQIRIETENGEIDIVLG